METAGVIMQLRGELEFCSDGALVLPIRNTRTAMGVVRGSVSTTPPDVSEQLVRADPSGGTVLYDPTPTPRSSPGYRTIWIKPVDRLESAVDALRDWQGRVESVGLALSPAREEALRTRLDQLGPSRRCEIGAMQTPPLRWRLIDQGLLTKLIQWNTTLLARTF
jgi:hypothetical protein